MGGKGVLTAVNTYRFFRSQLLDTDGKTEESPLLLLLHTDVLHPFLMITLLRGLLRLFLSNHSNEILAPQVHCKYVNLHFIQ